MNSVHLTDDEVVAVSGLLGFPWPFALPSIPLEQDELLAASRRGVRSLTVRALVGVDPDSDQPGLNEEVARAVTSVVRGEPLLASGVIADSGELRASSSGAYVVMAEDGSAVIGTVSATGIHVITYGETGEVLEAFTALVENALVAGIGGSETARLLVMRAGQPDRALAVAKGFVTEGALDQDSRFLAKGQPSQDWNRDRLARHLAA